MTEMEEVKILINKILDILSAQDERADRQDERADRQDERADRQDERIGRIEESIKQQTLLDYERHEETMLTLGYYFETTAKKEDLKKLTLRVEKLEAKLA
jgi:hypothetical protein